MLSYEKVYIVVFLRISDEGLMKPLAIEWKDGTRFRINKVIDEYNAPPAHTGGVLTRKFKVLINGKEKIIYMEKHTNRWFVEKPMY